MVQEALGSWSCGGREQSMASRISQSAQCLRAGLAFRIEIVQIILVKYDSSFLQLFFNQ